MKKTFEYKYDELFNPTLKALVNLGGSGSIDEIEEEVAKMLKLTDDQVNEIHKGNMTKLAYRLAWARYYLKKCGFIDNSSRGIWALTPKALKTPEVDKEVVKKTVVADYKQQRLTKEKGFQSAPVEEAIENEELQKVTWQEILIEHLQTISPAGFERLCQRILRELGFQNVEVTGKSNDGGIDGKGMLRLGGVLSFHVIFQAKRYKGSVVPSIVRDFRGAMVGRADKGLIITTGTFTREAKKEASRDGAPPIDLMDGNDLAEKIKELKLGVDIELVEKVTIKKEWFENI